MMVMVVGDYNADLTGDNYNVCGYKDFFRNKKRMNMVTDRNDVNCNIKAVFWILMEK